MTRKKILDKGEGAMNDQDRSIQERFEQYHKQNPQIYEKLVEYARRVKKAGFDRIGIQLLIERTRWHFMTEIQGGHEFKINNDYASRYSRLIMEKEPDLEGLFPTRELQRQG
jgi:hypothetical protein